MTVIFLSVLAVACFTEYVWFVRSLLLYLLRKRQIQVLVLNWIEQITKFDFGECVYIYIHVDLLDLLLKCKETARTCYQP